MDDLKKIELDQPLEKKEQIYETSSVHPMRKHGKKLLVGKSLAIFFVVLLLIVVISTFTIVLPAQRVYVSAKATYQQAKKTLDAMKKQNVQVASKELTKTKTELTNTQKNLNALSFLRFFPILGGYYSDADHLVKAGQDGLDASIMLVDSIKPYADVLGLKGQGSFVMGSAEQRIQTAVLTMGKITPRIDDIAKSLVLAKKEIDSVDPNHYPSFLGGSKIKSQLITMKTFADQGVVFIDQARPLIKVLPSLLGESKEKKYLVLFQNDKELRPTGGFITAYAIFRVDKGIIHVEKSDDIYNLDNNLRKKLPAPAPIATYLTNVTTFNIRDSNLSPDFVVSMDTFKSMYDNVAGKTSVDGIIAIDTHVLVSTIKILDDQIEASGLTFTTKNDIRCDCPQVIYELEDNISRPVGYQKAGRKDLLGSLLFAIMQKALKSSPKLYWGPLLQDMVTKVNEKHVLFDLDDKDAQAGIEALNGAGRIKSFDGDYLHINEANFGGAKSNLFVQEAVSQAIEVKNDGSVVKTVTVTYKNPHPPSDCNLERGNLCLNADLRDWFRVYVSKGSVLVSSTGSEVKVETKEELGKTYFEGFLRVRPLGAATLVLSYRLPFKLERSSPLPLLIQKQPGTDANQYTITFNGREVEKFGLSTDKDFKLKR